MGGKCSTAPSKGNTATNRLISGFTMIVLDVLKSPPYAALHFITSALRQKGNIHAEPQGLKSEAPEKSAHIRPFQLFSIPSLHTCFYLLFFAGTRQDSFFKCKSLGGMDEECCPLIGQSVRLLGKYWLMARRVLLLMARRVIRQNIIILASQ